MYRFTSFLSLFPRKLKNNAGFCCFSSLPVFSLKFLDSTHSRNQLNIHLYYYSILLYIIYIINARLHLLCKMNLFVLLVLPLFVFNLLLPSTFSSSSCFFSLLFIRLLFFYISFCAQILCFYEIFLFIYHPYAIIIVIIIIL